MATKTKSKKQVHVFIGGPITFCPMCQAFAIMALPASLLALQPDVTTHVCHPAYGGCNHGFELPAGS